MRKHFDIFGLAVLLFEGTQTPDDSVRASGIIRLLIPALPWSHETMPGNDPSAAKRARVPQRSPQPPRFIVIEGPLRVGKTTLARILAERLHARRIYDCEDNPFLADFYKAKPGSAFRAQTYFLMEPQKRLTKPSPWRLPAPSSPISSWRRTA